MRLTNTILQSSVLFSVILLINGCGNNDEAWDYSSEKGPEKWGDLSSKYKICKEGQAQSPINITRNTTVPFDLDPLSFDYPTSNLSIVNTGNVLRLNYAQMDQSSNNNTSTDNAVTNNESTNESTTNHSNQFLTGDFYTLYEIHFHTPSEHTIDNKSYPLEAHFVHSDNNNNIAVVGVLFEEGDSNDLLAKIFENIPTTANQVVNRSDVTFNARDLIPKNSDYYHYKGSLTEPPCTENVKWYVMAEPLSASTAQIQQLQNQVGNNNNRPVQPLNNRTVLRSNGNDDS